MVKRTPWLVVAVVMGWLPGLAWASEVDILLNKLVERGLLTASDASAVRGDIQAEAVQRPGGPAPAEELAATPRVQWNGDVRLRNEFLHRAGASDRNRQRVRFRMGFETSVTDALTAGARLATGSLTDPVSTNQTLDDTFTKKSFNLDQAYLAYHPDVPGLDRVSLIGGLMDNPFWTVGHLVWDDDLSFAGIAGRVAREVGLATLFANGGVFPVDADGFGTDNPALWSSQVGGTLRPFEATGTEVLDALAATGAVGFHAFSNVSRNTLINTQAGNTGRSEGINELNPTLELASRIGGLPTRVFGDYVRNTSAPDQNDGYQFGVSVGRATTPWSLRDGWEAGYFYEHLEADAVFDGFAYSDFGGGGTNHQGHAWWVKLATLKNSFLQVKYLDTEETRGAANYADTLQTDWVTTFSF